MSATIQNRIQNIGHREFESFVADLWELDGWDTRVTQGKRDGGVDVVAERTDGLVGQRLLIQAKRYSDGNKVGQQDVQQYAGVLQNEGDADIMAIVTSSSFTSGAEQAAEDLNIRLVDQDDIAARVSEADAEHLVDEYAPVLTDLTDRTDEDPPAGSVTAAGPRNDNEMPELLDEYGTMLGGGVLVLGVLIGVSASSGGGQAVGALSALVGIAVLVDAERVWNEVTPTRLIHMELSDGSKVVETGDSHQFEPSEGEPVAFDESAGGRRQALVYASLYDELNGVAHVDPGSIPTSIANEDTDVIAAYRYAVHRENPTALADDMGLTQQQVVDMLEKRAS